MDVTMSYEKGEQKLSDDDMDEEADEDAIALYGSTKHTNVRQPKLRPAVEELSVAADFSGRTGDICDVAVLNEGINDADVVLLSDPNSGQSMSMSHSSRVITKIFPTNPWWQHQKVRDNYKVVLASVMLTLFGTCLAVAGIAIEVSQNQAVQSYMFFAAGALCLIPGVYHLVYIYCAVKGTRGFSFYNMPIFK